MKIMIKCAGRIECLKKCEPHFVTVLAVKPKEAFVKQTVLYRNATSVGPLNILAYQKHLPVIPTKVGEKDSDSICQRRST